MLTEVAFGYLGQHAIKHDLTLGILLAWLPVLVLSTIIDRRISTPVESLNQFNSLIRVVRHALEDSESKQECIRVLQDRFPASSERMKALLEGISRHSQSLNDDFFVGYAGTICQRWHNGAAHPILSDIERTYIAERGRAWLTDEESARVNLVLGDIKSLDWVSSCEVWQIVMSVVIVGFPVMAALFMSFFTPTVGLGCRSGGMLIFLVNSFLLVCIELSFWRLITPTDGSSSPNPANTSAKEPDHPVARFLFNMVNSARLKANDALDFLDYYISRSFNTHPKADSERPLRSIITAPQKWTIQQRAERFYFRPLEILNASWLIYIVIAQAIGSYSHDCSCQASLWGSGGGYISLTQYARTSTPIVKWSWSIGTAVGCSVMAFAMIYIVLEWCLQSVSTKHSTGTRYCLRKS